MFLGWSASIAPSTPSSRIIKKPERIPRPWHSSTDTSARWSAPCPRISNGSASTESPRLRPWTKSLASLLHRESSQSPTDPTSGRREADAKALLKKRLGEIGKGKLIGPTAEKVTFED